MTRAHVPYDPSLVSRIADSYERALGAPLAPLHLSRDDRARYLFDDAPYCLLAHDSAPDPRFIYANRAALRCFEYGWDELVGLPSRLSAEAPNRAERDALLASVAARGYATGYRGLRIASSGRRFWIEDVTVWNVLDDAGLPLGQAATYRRITPAP